MEEGTKQTPQQKEFADYLDHLHDNFPNLKNARIKGDTGFGKTFNSMRLAKRRAEANKFTIISFPNKELINNNFKVYLSDFGLSQKFTADDDKTLLDSTRIILTTHEYLSYQKWSTQPYKCIQDVLDRIKVLYEETKHHTDLLVIIDEADVYYQNCVYSIPMGNQYYKQEGNSYWSCVNDYFTNGIRNGMYVSKSLQATVSNGNPHLAPISSLNDIKDTSDFVELPEYPLEETPYDCSKTGKVKYYPIDKSKLSKDTTIVDLDWRSISNDTKTVAFYMQGFLNRLPIFLDSCYVMKKVIFDTQENTNITYDEYLKLKKENVNCDGDMHEQLNRFNERFEFNEFALQSTFVGFDLRFLKMLNKSPFIKVFEFSAGYDTASEDARNVAFDIASFSELFHPGRFIFKDFDGATFWQPQVNVLLTKSSIKFHNNAPKRLAETFGSTKGTIGDVLCNTFTNLKTLVFQPLKNQTEKLTSHLKFGECYVENKTVSVVSNNDNKKNHIFSYTNGVFGRGVNNFTNFDVVFVPVLVVKPPYIYLAKDDKDLNEKIITDVANSVRQNIGRIIRNDPSAEQKQKWIVLYSLDERITEVVLKGIKSMCAYPLVKEVKTEKQDKGTSIVLKLSEEITGYKLPEVDEKQRVNKDWVLEYTKKIMEYKSQGLSSGIIRKKLNYGKCDKKEIIDSILIPLDNKELEDKIKALKATGLSSREIERKINYHRLDEATKKVIGGII